MFNRDDFPVFNSTDEDIPMGGFMRPSGGLEVIGGLNTGCLSVAKPNADDDTHLCVCVGASIPKKTRGTGTFHYRAPLAFDPASGNPAVSDELGSKNGSWYAHKGKKGWKALTGPYGSIVNSLRVEKSSGVVTGEGANFGDFSITTSAFGWQSTGQSIPTSGVFAPGNYLILWTVTAEISGSSGVPASVYVRLSPSVGDTTSQTTMHVAMSQVSTITARGSVTIVLRIPITAGVNDVITLQAMRTVAATASIVGTSFGGNNGARWLKYS